MLGYVKQDLYDREVAAREKAETDVADLRMRLDAAQATNTRLLEEFSGQRESHERQMAGLLEHIAPKPQPSPLMNDENLFRRLSAEEILSLPASTHREMQARAHQARLARAREEQDADKNAREARERMFTTAEHAEIRGEYDGVLGVYLQAKEVPNVTN